MVMIFCVTSESLVFAPSASGDLFFLIGSPSFLISVYRPAGLSTLAILMKSCRAPELSRTSDFLGRP